MIPARVVVGRSTSTAAGVFRRVAFSISTGISAMGFVSLLEGELCRALQAVLGVEQLEGSVNVQPTRPEFEGDYTLVVFPWVKVAKCAPPVLATRVGDWICEHSQLVSTYAVKGGFLNITLSDAAWRLALEGIELCNQWGFQQPNSTGKTVMVEFSSPNTNKPLHLGHIRNILLGHSVSALLVAAGHKVIKANLVNDRGIHICKSMVAWLRYGHGETPESSGMKGDHLVGKYYVEYDRAYKEEVHELITEHNLQEEQAKLQAPILLEAQEMLRKWEAHDEQVYALWRKMNGWVYRGFDATYQAMGITFDRTYYESETYLLGKEIVLRGLKDGILYQREDGSVWADLRADGLDEKLLLRADGTSVYMTQDIGTAIERFEEYSLDSMVYVVGNEQEYHFQVLSLVLSKLGYTWARRLYHLSYGMVFLPDGKMKSREGTVVDADDLMDSVCQIAAEMAQERGKVDALSATALEQRNRAVGLAALKYFILKVDPSKNMTFNPHESIDFNGNTGPFIQYTHARACSILRKVGEPLLEGMRLAEDIVFNQYERMLLRRLNQYPDVLRVAAEQLSPAVVANFAYELAKDYNQFYHECPIAQEECVALQTMRLELTKRCVLTIRSALGLLGIEAIEQM